MVQPSSFLNPTPFSLLTPHSSLDRGGSYIGPNGYNGAAPDAKIAFDDISNDGRSLSPIPYNLNTGAALNP